MNKIALYSCGIAYFVLFTSSHSVGQTKLAGLGNTGTLEKIASGFEFLEGPAKAPDGSVYFTDIPPGKILRLTTNDKIETFFTPSLHANGLMYGGENKLLACQMDGRLVAIDLTSKEVAVLADKYNGKRFNACNDLVIDKQGGIYFTDPRFRAPEPWPQGKEAFYYRSAEGDVIRLGEDLPAPNGIALSPDEKTLYVIPSRQCTMMAYEIESPGKLGSAKEFCILDQVEGQTDGGGDGLAVDVQGNLYITAPKGIQVVSPEGKTLGIIAVPEKPANCAFAGKHNKTLIITARTGLYRCNMPVAGLIHRNE